MTTRAGNLGNLLVSIGTDLTALDRGMKDADRSVKDFERSGEKSMLSFQTVGVVAATAVAAAFIKLSKDTFAYGQQLHQLSVQTGMSAKELARLQFITGQVDASFEGVTSSLKFLSRSMFEAFTGNKDMQSQFNRLGISITDAEGRLRKATDVLYEMGPALQSLRNETAMMAIGQKVLGRGFQENIGFFRTSKEEMDELQKKNINATDKLNAFALAVDSISDKFAAWRDSTKNFLAEAGLPFLQWLDRVTDAEKKQAEARAKNLEAMRANPDVQRFLQQQAENQSPSSETNFRRSLGLPENPSQALTTQAGVPRAPGAAPEAGAGGFGSGPFESRYGTGKGQQAPAGFYEGGIQNGQGFGGVNFGDITAKMEELKTKWKDVSKQVAEVWGNTMEQISTGFGQGVADMIVDGQDFGQSMKELWKDIAKSIIAEIVKIIAQQIILFTWQTITGTVGSGNMMGGGGKKKFFGIFDKGGVMPRAKNGMMSAASGMTMTGNMGEAGIPAIFHPNEIVSPIDKFFEAVKNSAPIYNQIYATGRAADDPQLLAELVAIETDRRRRRP